MRTLIAVSSTLIVVMALGRVGSSQGAALRPDVSRPVVTQAQFERWQTELSNWGRWGKNDEIGALNLITPAKRKQALALVKEGLLGILGIDILDRADFDSLGEAAAARNRWEFMLTIAPLPIPHGTGSPVNPIAMF